jgi:hypothetical protein
MNKPYVEVLRVTGLFSHRTQMMKRSLAVELLSRKEKAGAEVKIFFMTDDRKSQSHPISENKLKCLRTGEALAASRMLGLEKNDILALLRPS